MQLAEPALDPGGARGSARPGPDEAALCQGRAGCSPLKSASASGFHEQAGPLQEPWFDGERPVAPSGEGLRGLVAERLLSSAKLRAVFSLVGLHPLGNSGKVAQSLLLPLKPFRTP